MVQEKLEAQKQWNNRPCGQVGTITEDAEYFSRVEKNRYERYATWMKSFYNYDKYKGKRVLEIGFGQGTDLVQFAKGGAECYGVDITERHFDLAKKNLKTRGLEANLFLEDASKLHFKDNFFDRIYSFGVLHHTPDIEDCVKEAHRVLKPNQEFVITLYHQHSFFYYTCKLLREGILYGKLFSLGHDGLLATIEGGADGKKIKPYVKLYSTKSMKTLLKDFKDVKIDIKHLDNSQIWILGKFLPKKIVAMLEPYFGWYIIGTAKK